MVSNSKQSKIPQAKKYVELGGAPVNLSELEQELPVGGKGSGSTEALNIVGALERPIGALNIVRSP